MLYESETLEDAYFADAALIFSILEGAIEYFDKKCACSKEMIT